MTTLLLTGAGAAADAAFTPLSLSPSLLLDASAITGRVNNDLLPTWLDGSGNTRDAAQAADALKPTYKTAQQNGLAGVSFGGSAEMVTPAWAQTSARTIFAVAKPHVIASNGVLLDTGAGTEQAIFLPSSAWAGYQGSTDTFGAAVVDRCDYITYQFNGASSFGRVNGTQDTGNPGSGALSNTTMLIGKNPAGSLHYNGLLFELIVVPALSSTGEISSVETYLKAKWGL